jgi:ABC-type bacteriocin/lantibiotic exporter with double-glycine peptidase domain
MPDEMVVDAAKLACIHDDILAMPNGLRDATRGRR